MSNNMARKKIGKDKPLLRETAYRKALRATTTKRPHPKTWANALKQFPRYEID